MKVLIPMAGRGSRFQSVSDTNPEYRKPKPLISIKGRPMISWAIESLPFIDLPQRHAKTKYVVSPKDLIFISLQQQEKEYHITKLLTDLFTESITVLLIPEVTRGALETALQAKKYINMEEDLLISDSDHFFDGSFLNSAIEQKGNEVRGIIPVFQPPDDEPKWSYTLFDTSHTAIAVGEKDAELAKKGAYANIGAYYFSSGSEFCQEAEEMIRDNQMYGPEGKKEFFIAPLYQRMIEKGKKIQAAVTPTVWGLGTPKDVEYFLANYK